MAVVAINIGAYSCKDKCVNESKDITHACYKDGVKMCSVCRRAIKTEASRCYCCHILLRLKPRRGKAQKAKIANAVRH